MTEYMDESDFANAVANGVERAFKRAPGTLVGGVQNRVTLNVTLSKAAERELLAMIRSGRINVMTQQEADRG